MPRTLLTRNRKELLRPAEIILTPAMASHVAFLLIVICRLLPKFLHATQKASCSHRFGLLLPGSTTVLSGEMPLVNIRIAQHVTRGLELTVSNEPTFATDPRQRHATPRHLPILQHMSGTIFINTKSYTLFKHIQDISLAKGAANPCNKRNLLSTHTHTPTIDNIMLLSTITLCIKLRKNEVVNLAVPAPRFASNVSSQASVHLRVALRPVREQRLHSQCSGDTTCHGRQQVLSQSWLQPILGASAA